MQNLLIDQYFCHVKAQCTSFVFHAGILAVHCIMEHKSEYTSKSCPPLAPSWTAVAAAQFLPQWENVFRRGCSRQLAFSPTMRSDDASSRASIPSGHDNAAATVAASDETRGNQPSVESPKPHHVPFSEFHRNTKLEAIRGASSSVVSIILTFPLNKLMSRQLYEGLTVSEAFHTMKVEGWGNLYRGVAPILMQKAVSMGIMYGSYDFFYHAVQYALTGMVEQRTATDIPTSESAWYIRSIAAVLSGSIEGILTPFERVQTILQHRHYTDQFSNAVDVVSKLRTHGISEYYRGVTAIIARNGPANAIFFTLRDPIRNMVPAWPTSDEAMNSRKPSDPGAGAPLQTAQSTTTTSAPAGPDDTGRLSDNVVAAGALVGSSILWNLFRDFFSGAVLGAGISTLMYPLNMAKGVMQLQIGGRFRGIGETILQVYHERNGVRGMYRGAGINMMRSLLSWGVVNMTYEVLKRMTRPVAKPPQLQ